MPEYLVTKPRASMQTIARIAGTIRRIVRASSRAWASGERPSNNPLSTAARKTAVPVDDNGTTSTWALSRSPGK